MLCAAIFTALPASVRSEEAPKAQSDMEATEPGTLDAAKQDKPWLITPDPFGGPQARRQRRRVDCLLKATGCRVHAVYDRTDHFVLRHRLFDGGAFSQLYWGADTRRLSLLAATAEINNEYDDFLGTGQAVKTQDNVHTYGFRYLHQLRKGGWFGGIQGISTNYAVGADGLLEGLMTQVGLAGFDATGLGLVFQHDTMNHQRDPSAGHLLHVA